MKYALRCAYSFDEKNPRIHDGIDDKGKKIWLFDMPVNIKRIYVGCEANKDFVKTLENMNCTAPVVKMKKQIGKYGVVPEGN